MPDPMTEAKELRGEAMKHRGEPNDLAYLHYLVVEYASQMQTGPAMERRKAALRVADVVYLLRDTWRAARQNNPKKADQVGPHVLENAFGYLADGDKDDHRLRVAQAWIDNLRMIATEDLHEQPGKG